MKETFALAPGFRLTPARVRLLARYLRRAMRQPILSVGHSDETKGRARRGDMTSTMTHGMARVRDRKAALVSDSLQQRVLPLEASQGRRMHALPRRVASLRRESRRNYIGSRGPARTIGTELGGRRRRWWRQRRGRRRRRRRGWGVEFTRALEGRKRGNGAKKDGVNNSDRCPGRWPAGRLR